ncbi:hypothetical protein Tco_1333220, partial [Tanacetum coccineum]
LYEIRPILLQLLDEAAAFWKCMNNAESDDLGDLAAIGCLCDISTIIESVSRLP